MKIIGKNYHFCYQLEDMTKYGYQRMDLFWSSWQVTKYSSNVFNVTYDLSQAAL